MKRIQFPLVKEGTRVVYPDDISLFRGATIRGDVVVAQYSGEMVLDEFAGTDPVDKREMTKYAFRSNMLTAEQRKRYDKLKARLEDDATFLEMCPNVTAGTLEAYRDEVRTLFVDLDEAAEVALSDPQLARGLDLLEQIGFIAAGEAKRVRGGYRPQPAG